MILRSKLWHLYLTMIFILTYVGVFFIGDVFSSDGHVFFNKIYPLTLILGNTFAVYWISLNYSQRERTAFWVAALYCVSPFHLSVFFFPAQSQFLISETCLLLFMIFYLKNSFVKSMVFMIAAFLLNFKLLALVPFLSLSKKFSPKLKLFMGLSCLSILIFSYPLFWTEQKLLFNNYKTVAYLLEKIIFPNSLSFLNYSVIIHNYYSLWFLNLVAVSCLIFGIYYYYKKYPFSEVVLTLILGCGLSIFLPVKNIFVQVIQVNYFKPEYFPFILLLFLILTLVILTKYSSKKVEWLLAIIGIIWMVSSISLQQKSNNTLAIWNNAIAMLPANYDYEEEIKFDYVTMLIAQDLKEEAEQIIIQAKRDYKKEKWFALHLKLAVQRKDKKTIQDIYDELVRYKIPYVNSALPEETP